MKPVCARDRRDLWDDLRARISASHSAVLRRTPSFTSSQTFDASRWCIGANSAAFSVVDSVLLRPLPYPESGQLVQLWADYRVRNGRAAPEWLTPPDFVDWRDQNKTFAAMASYQNWGPILTGSGEPQSLAGLAVTGDFFRVLGVPAALGRTITPADDVPDAEPVVVLSHALWQTQFGGDRTVIDRRIELNGQSARVVGVMPACFRTPVAGIGGRDRLLAGASPGEWRLGGPGKAASCCAPSAGSSPASRSHRRRPTSAPSPGVKRRTTPEPTKASVPG